MDIRKCFYCDEEIQKNDSCWMIPIEGKYPNEYGNIFFHKNSCYLQIENIHDYLISNSEKIFEYISNNIDNVAKKYQKKSHRKKIF